MNQKYRTLRQNEIIRKWDEWFNICTEKWEHAKVVGIRAWYSAYRRLIKKRKSK